SVRPNSSPNARGSRQNRFSTACGSGQRAANQNVLSTVDKSVALRLALEWFFGFGSTQSPLRFYPMDLIKTPSGNLIDADAVSFIGKTQNNAGNAITVFVGGQETVMSGDDADGFLLSFHGHTKADVSDLQRWIPKRQKS